MSKGSKGVEGLRKDLRMGGGVKDGSLEELKGGRALNEGNVDLGRCCVEGRSHLYKDWNA